MTLLEQWQKRAMDAEKKVEQALELLKGSTSSAAKRAVDVLKGEYEVKTPEKKKDEDESEDSEVSEG